MSEGFTGLNSFPGIMRPSIRLGRIFGIDQIRPLPEGQGHRASGLGRSWKRAAFGLFALPPSRWNIVLVPEVDHNDLPFQPAFGSSMRPSTFLGQKPLGYGIRKVMNLPSTSA